MAKISPFRALHYNPKQFSDLSEVISPPYDCISKEQEATFLERSPYNICHLILSQKEGDDYAAQKERLHKWIEQKILVQDETPGLYLYRQEFSVLGKKHQRDTLMALVQLHEFGDAVIRPHENTYGKYKADRLQLLRQLECNDSHIFGMVRDDQGFLATHYDSIAYRKPLLRGTDDEGVINTVWKIDGEAVAEFTQFFADRPIYIVDGHHRYESSVAYAKEQGALGKPDHPAAHMLFAIASTKDPGLVVLPTHRLVSGIAAANLSLEKIRERFDLSPMPEEELIPFTQKTNFAPQFALWVHGKLWRCQPLANSTVVREHGETLARNAVLWSDWILIREIAGISDDRKRDHIFYEKSAELAWEHRTSTSLVIFHGPLAVDEVAKVADEKRFMPQKTTFFYPKLAAGIALRKHR